MPRAPNITKKFKRKDIMKRFKSLALLLALLLTLGISIGCQKKEEVIKEEVSEQAVEQATEAYTVTDMMGRELEFAQVPTKVVALRPSDSEILDALGAIDTLIGRGTYVDYPESVLDLPVVATGREMNAEEIIALEPDLILMTDMAQTEEQVETLQNAGINVVVTKADTIEEVYDSIILIGQVMGLEENAQAVIDGMKADFKSLSQKAEENAGKKIYFEVSPLEYGLWTSGTGTFMNEVAEILGLENIFADIEGWAEVSEEEVIARNPDYILTITMGSTAAETPVEEIIGRAGWEGLSAVQNEKVLNLTDNSLSRPSSRLVEGAKALSEFVSN